MFPVGERENGVRKRLKLNIMVCGWGRVLCCYKYVEVVLTCVCGFLCILASVSLLCVY